MEETAVAVAQVASTQLRWGTLNLARPLLSSLFFREHFISSLKGRKKPVAPADGVDDSLLLYYDLITLLPLLAFYLNEEEGGVGWDGMGGTLWLLLGYTTWNLAIVE